MEIKLRKKIRMRRRKIKDVILQLELETPSWQLQFYTGSIP